MRARQFGDSASWITGWRAGGITTLRKRREVDPTLILLRDCLEEQKKFGKLGKRDEHTEGRLEALQEFFESAAGSYERMRTIPTVTLRRLAKMGDKMLKFLKAA